MGTQVPGALAQGGSRLLLRWREQRPGFPSWVSLLSVTQVRRTKSPLES